MLHNSIAVLNIYVISWPHSKIRWICFNLCSSSPMATPLPRAQMMLPAGCLTCVLTRSWWFTHMITSSAVSPPSHSPRVAAYCWLAMMTSTAMSGTLWRLTVQVSLDAVPLMVVSTASHPYFCLMCNSQEMCIMCELFQWLLGRIIFPLAPYWLQNWILSCIWI